MNDNSLISILMSVIKMLLANIPFILLCLTSKKANLNKISRSKQFPLPVVAVIYSIIILIFIDGINSFLVGRIQVMVEWLRTWTGVNGLPEEVNQFIASLSKKAAEWIAALNLSFWVFFISNTLIMVLYLAVKNIVIRILDKAVNNDSKLYKDISEHFYDYHEEKDVWCIRDNLIQARQLLMVFYYASVFIAVIMMMATKRLYLNEILKSVFYPVFSIIMVGEVYFYLDGISWGEYLSNILGENEDASKTVNYTLLRKFLRSLFGDKMLADNTLVNNTLTYSTTNYEIIEDLENNEDPKISAFGTYIRHITEDGFQIDHNYIYSSVELLKGKSVLFNDPFYNDLIPYAFYPMNRELLKHNKVLVILGRHAIEDDIVSWLEKGICSVTNLPYLWNINVLSGEKSDTDIGIVTCSDMFKSEIREANSGFLGKVTYVVIIEPSRLMPTSQIGLELLIKKCRENNNDNITFCLCDKNCDGLVDAISHALATNLTEVAATNRQKGTTSYMCWDPGSEHLHHRQFPNVSRYLGTGTELSFAALKNQVSKTQWFGGETFPVSDINWIDRQYYFELAKYANIPANQESFSERFVTSPNFWSAAVSENNYFTVEDESFNMFEILRDFSTRSTEQGFINVISSDYLLKDYMAINSPIFETDPKAIPYFSADYARTERNTAFRLILQMSAGPMKTEKVAKELSLLGLEIFDIEKQVWLEIYKSFTGVKELIALPSDYKQAVYEVFNRPIIFKNSEIRSSIISVYEEYNVNSGYIESFCTINDKGFIDKYASGLKSAGYIVEDGNGDRDYLGAELCGHIYQKLLPGQFFTFGGKYYEMLYLTSDSRVLVRRAADHIDGRKNYRQIRDYSIGDIIPSEKIGASVNISGLKISEEFADFSVDTPGYYLLERYSDFKNAKKIVFEGGANKIPPRSYKNKQILKIDFPEMGGKYSDKVRFTITVLLNEVFRTLFAENQQYITAVTDTSFLAEETDSIEPLTCSLSGENISKTSIYIVEDSELDLGLLITVKRNLERIFKIIDDYLDWHFEALKLVFEPPELAKPYSPPKQEEGPEEKKKGIFARIKDFFKKIFCRKKDKKKKKKGNTEEEKPVEIKETEAAEGVDEGIGEGKLTPDSDIEVSFVSSSDGEITDTEEETDSFEEDPAPEDASGEAPADASEEIHEEISEEEPASDGAQSDEAVNAEDDDMAFFSRSVFKRFRGKKNEEAPVEETVHEAEENQPEGTEEAEGSGEPEAEGTETESEKPESEGTEEGEATAEPAEKYRAPYSEIHFLLFGGDSVPNVIALDETLELLNGMGFDKNELRQAREARKAGVAEEEKYVPNKLGSKYCDFCGTEIFGVEYETLKDGRDRCVFCGNTAVKSGEEFKKIFNDVKRNMESFYGIRINVGIRVEMVNSKKLQKKLGDSFVPTDNFDPRTIGLAIKDKNGYSLLIENGAPRIQSMLVVAHELTHIWQYLTWDDKALKSIYGKDGLLELHEGMAKWAEIQYAYLINEPITAKREEICTLCRDDEYGRGFKRYLEVYPFSTGTNITKPTPFLNIKDPLNNE